MTNWWLDESHQFFHNIYKSKRKLIPMTPAFAALRHPLAGGGMSSSSIFLFDYV